MIDTSHENAVKVENWFIANNKELDCSDQSVVQIYNDVSYYGKITESLSFKDRTQIMKKQISFIRKNILGLMYRQNNSVRGIKAGYVYAVENPAWKDYVKIGATIDVYDRLNSYQTSCPFRDYSLIGYVFTHDKFSLEKEIHDKFERNGEWIKTDKSTIKRFLKDHEQFPEDAISRFCLEEVIKAIGLSSVVFNEKVEKLKVKRFLSLVKSTLTSISEQFKTLDVKSPNCVRRQNRVWYYKELDLKMVVEDGYVKVLFDK